jgi:hypothetical protein
MTYQTQCEEFVERLADLLERDIDEATRAALESHAFSCGDCGPLLADLRKLRIDASSLPVLEPKRELWDGILARIDAPIIPLRGGNETGATRVRLWQRWMPLAAAAVLLIALTSTSTYYLTVRASADSAAMHTAAVVSSPRADTAVQVPSQSSLAAATTRQADSARESTASSNPVTNNASAPRFVSAKRSAQQVYADEISRLRIVLDRRRGQLDPVTVSVIERNLQVIDDAIAQCKLALAKDPASRFLMESLNNALENKVELLRTATMLPAHS